MRSQEAFVAGRDQVRKGTFYRSYAPLRLLVGLWSFHVYRSLSENIFFFREFFFREYFFFFQRMYPAMQTHGKEDAAIQTLPVLQGFPILEPTASVFLTASMILRTINTLF